MDAMYLKQLSPTLQMKLTTNRNRVFFLRKKISDQSTSTKEISKDLLELILRNATELQSSFMSEDLEHHVLHSDEGYTRFHWDCYWVLQLWIRPRDNRNNFNISRLEFECFLSWRALLCNFFSLVSTMYYINSLNLCSKLIS